MSLKHLLTTVFVAALVPFASLAATPAPPPAAPTLFGLSMSNDASAKSASMPLQIAILLTALTLLPAVVMCITPFLRITLVLHFLRQALGTQTVPSNQVLVGLSLFLTLLVMNPVVQQIYRDSWQPMEAGKLTATQALDRGSQPLRQFLARFCRERDIRLFTELSHSPKPNNIREVPLTVLIPSYIVSELRTGFQIGAVLYLPFLIIDLVVASITVSIGMMQLPPAMVSAPFKILLFVLIDGWNVIAGSLVKSFLQ
jgi:flagellar biosynthetic protein FliP